MSAPSTSASTSTPFTYVIEHLEAGFDDGDWCLREYQHCIDIVSAPRLLITNIKPSQVSRLNEGLSEPIKGLHSEQTSFVDLPIHPYINKDASTATARVCMLDMRAEKELSTADATHFTHFLFGGVLGDDPPRDRTSHLRSPNYHYEFRHLGNRQMTTDTAILVSKYILEAGAKLSDLETVDDPEIPTGTGESTIMPFRYVTQRYYDTHRVRCVDRDDMEPELVKAEKQSQHDDEEEEDQEDEDKPDPLLAPGMRSVMTHDLDKELALDEDTLDDLLAHEMDRNANEMGEVGLQEHDPEFYDEDEGDDDGELNALSDGDVDVGSGEHR